MIVKVDNTFCLVHESSLPETDLICPSFLVMNTAMSSFSSSYSLTSTFAHQ